MSADQRGAKGPREPGSMAQHDVRLPVGHPDQNSAFCLIVRHRLTPSASSPDPSAGSIGEPDISTILSRCRRQNLIMTSSHGSQGSSPHDHLRSRKIINIAQVQSELEMNQLGKDVGDFSFPLIQPDG